MYVGRGGSAMADQFDENGGEMDRLATGFASSLQLARLLVIDGEDVSRFRIASDLKHAGAFVDFACSADEALESVAQARGAGEPYDLIILDLSAFGRDGYGVVERLRDSQFAGPILALTDKSPHRAGVRGIEAGCEELLQKPVASCVLLDASATLVSREKARRYVLARPEEVTSELSAYPELMMMLRRFVTNLPEAVESVLSAQRERDIQKLHDELDLIKRNATSHGYLEIRASAVSVQQELDQARKPDAAQVAEAIDDLVDLCHRATASPSKPPPTSGPPLPPSG
jgi:DNA-binding response OmpR family regulator